MPSSFTVRTIVSSLAVTHLCSGSVPHRITATGIEGFAPSFKSLLTMRGRFFQPIRTTSVALPEATPPQSIAVTAFRALSWPVIILTDEAMPLCVSGMPLYAAAAMAELTPGMTSNGMDSAWITSASSPPRPKINGSPPLSLTTTSPLVAYFKRSSFIWSCVV